MSNKNLEKLTSVGIIGFGNMGSSMASYLSRSGYSISAYDKLQSAGSFASKMQDVAKRDVIFVCVKPKDMGQVLAELKSELDATGDSPLIISIAAGFSIDSIEKILGEKRKIIRAMPNLGAKVGLSVTGFSPNKNVSVQDLQIIFGILGSFGTSCQTREDLMDGVTAISGSGPAYFFYLARQMEKAAEEMGFDAKTAETLCRNTLIAAGKLLENNEGSFEEIISKIKTPGGTTAAALDKFEKEGVAQGLISGIYAAQKRGAELNNR